VLVPISDAGRTYIGRVFPGNSTLRLAFGEGVVRGYHHAKGRLAAIITNQTEPSRIVSDLRPLPEPVDAM
jgi:hypothetical protein